MLYIKVKTLCNANIAVNVTMCMHDLLNKS